MKFVMVYAKAADQPFAIRFGADRCISDGEVVDFYAGTTADDDECVATFILGEIVGWVFSESDQ